jgi:hypothetical protein
MRHMRIYEVIRSKVSGYELPAEDLKRVLEELTNVPVFIEGEMVSGSRYWELRIDLQHWRWRLNEKKIYSDGIKKTISHLKNWFILFEKQITEDKRVKL